MLKRNPVFVALSFACAVLALCSAPSLSARAAAQFDPAFYGAAYPDVVAVFGTDPQALLNHYLAYGMAEGRFPSAQAQPGEAVDGIVRLIRPHRTPRRRRTFPLPNRLRLRPGSLRRPPSCPFPWISWPICPASANA